MIKCKHCGELNVQGASQCVACGAIFDKNLPDDIIGSIKDVKFGKFSTVDKREMMIPNEDLPPDVRDISKKIHSFEIKSSSSRGEEIVIKLNDGTAQTYHSMDEIPLEIRTQFEKLRSTFQSKLGFREIPLQSIQVQKDSEGNQAIQVKNTDGTGKIFTSVEQMPSELQERIKNMEEQIGRKISFPPDKKYKKKITLGCSSILFIIILFMVFYIIILG